ncbi:MAG: rhodanese-like domain-containing protein [Burkholderiales bacterium]
MKFVIENWWLIAAMAISGGFLLWPEIQKLLGASAEIGTLEAVQMINQKNAIVLDVREIAEYAGGRIVNARQIPMSELESKLKTLEKFKEKPIIVTCKTGLRSAAAIKLLKNNAFNQVYQLKGGLTAWQQANLPLETQS